MIIECPSCGARAKIPESKEGAKVRCVECERIYVARNASARGGGGGRQSSAALPIGIGAGVVALVMILLMVTNRDAPDTTDTPEVPKEAPPPLVDETGWNSKMVVYVRGLHDAAYKLDEHRLAAELALDHVWARVHSTEEEPVDPSAFADLGTQEVDDFRDEIVQELIADDPENLVGSWKPFDGSVTLEEDRFGVVRLMLEPRSDSEATGSRNIEWQLVKVNGDWKVWSWERWLSESEKKKRGPSTRKTTRTTLSDGSVVIEAEPGPIPYMDETPQPQREEIDRLIEKLIDLELPAKEASRVKSELTLAGKHAIPPLLTKFYEMNLAGFPDMDSAIRAQQVHMALFDITGYDTTFKAHEVLGATKERRDSGVRQWFGWYHREFKRFEGLVPEDLPDMLDEMIDIDRMTPEEKREYEKMKRLIEQEEKERKAREERNKQNNG